MYVAKINITARSGNSGYIFTVYDDISLLPITVRITEKDKVINLIGVCHNKTTFHTSNIEHFTPRSAVFKTNKKNQFVFYPLVHDKGINGVEYAHYTEFYGGKVFGKPVEEFLQLPTDHFKLLYKQLASNPGFEPNATVLSDILKMSNLYSTSDKQMSRDSMMILSGSINLKEKKSMVSKKEEQIVKPNLVKEALSKGMSLHEKEKPKVQNAYALNWDDFEKELMQKTYKSTISSNNNE